MNKPITVMYEDFKQEMVSLINNSGLPAFMIEPVLRDCLDEVRLLAKKQYLTDKEQYENALSQDTKNV